MDNFSKFIFLSFQYYIYVIIYYWETSKTTSNVFSIKSS